MVKDAVEKFCGVCLEGWNILFVVEDGGVWFGWLGFGEANEWSAFGDKGKIRCERRKWGSLIREMGNWVDVMREI